MAGFTVPFAIISILYQFWFIARFTGGAPSEQLGISLWSAAEFLLLAFGLPAIVIPATIVSFIQIVMAIPKILSRETSYGLAALFLIAMLLPLVTYNIETLFPRPIKSTDVKAAKEAKPLTARELESRNRLEERTRKQEYGR